MTRLTAGPAPASDRARRERDDHARLRQPRVVIDVSGWGVVKLMAGLLALAFVTELAGQMRDVFVWTLAAAFLAIALNPLVERLEPRLGRRPAATVVFARLRDRLPGGRGGAGGAVRDAGRPAFDGLPQAISDARQDSTIKRLDQRFHIAEHAKEHLGDLPNVVFGAADTVLGGAVAVSTVFFLTLFLLYELPASGARSCWPRCRRNAGRGSWPRRST